MVNAPVIPGKLDVRISIINQHRDDWVTNIYTGGYAWRKNLEGFNDLAGRFQAIYHFDDSFNILFEADVRHLEGTATLFRANIVSKGSNGLASGFDPAQVEIDGDNYRNVNTRGGHVTLHKDLKGYGIDFISAYEHAAIKSRGDIDGGYPAIVPFDVETATVTPAVDQFTEELRLSASHGGRLFNQAGAYCFHEYIDDYDQDFSPGRTAHHPGQRASEHGARRPVRLRELSPDRQADDPGGCALHFGLSHLQRCPPVWRRRVPAIRHQGRRRHENFLSKAGSETTTSYEVGLKGAMFRRRAIFTVDAYMWDTNNLQLTASGGNANITELVNAKKMIGRGVEGQLDLQPLPHLTMSGNASCNFTEIQDPDLEITPCGDGCTVINPIDPATENARINGNARYAIPLRRDDGIFLSTDWSRRSGEDFSLYRSVEFDGKPLLLGGFALGYKNYAKRYQVDLFVRNVLDRIVAVGSIDFDNLEIFINDPRLVGVEGHVAFEACRYIAELVSTT